MSTEKQTVMVRDLVEEAKKRSVILGICVVGLSYLMSLTSSSVWVNLPAAALLIIIFRYLAMDYEMRRKAAVYNSRPTAVNIAAQKKPVEYPKAVKKPSWRNKVNSPAVEDAIDKFTRHLISEWVTDLWYSRLTPDREGPEELVEILNGGLGEISCRMRNINLIDLLTRDVIHLVSNHLELFRACQAKIEKQKLGSLTFDQRDVELRSILAAENKLHPALFSAEAEHKVLQHLMASLVPLTVKPEDLQCFFFRYIARELLACAVMRPVLNLASPRFINERIESLVISMRNVNRGARKAQDASPSKQNGNPKISPDHFSRFLDPSVTGVELVQLKNNQSKNSLDNPRAENVNGADQSKDPLLLVDAHSTRSWSSLPSNSETNGKSVQQSTSGGEWGDMLDYFSRRKTQALAPENFENMWTKGRNYEKKEAQLGDKAPQRSSTRTSNMVNSYKVLSVQKDKDGVARVKLPNRGAVLYGSDVGPSTETRYSHADRSTSSKPLLTPVEEDDENQLMASDETDTGSSSCYSSQEEDSSVTGLDTPTTKVWDSRNNRSTGVAHIRHPLESSDGKMARRTHRGHYQRMPKMSSDKQLSRLGNEKLHVWQEVERTSFLSGDGQDILKPPKENTKDDDSNDDYDLEINGRVLSGAAASSSADSLPESYNLSAKSHQTIFLGDTFFKLRCEVLGANIVKSSSKTFAVYSISVTDTDNNSWSIKRRFRHFEELHRRLKEYPEYDLHLPPKQFLSTGLDVPVILERCKLLDRYLKDLMRLPTVSGSIEVWDFLSVDSQSYAFSSAFSIVETLSVSLNDKPAENSASISSFGGPTHVPSKSWREHAESENKESTSRIMYGSPTVGLKLDRKGSVASPVKIPGKGFKKPLEDSGSDSETKVHDNFYSAQDLVKAGKANEIQDSCQKSERCLDAAGNPVLPVEWVPPNLSAPILDLVDVVFQLQEGGWIRRKAFWVAKQILQLGMGDALDDWLIEKIQLLHRGSVIASLIQRVEQALWPDGIFLTKHPKRRRLSLPGSSSLPASPSQFSSHHQRPDQISSPKVEDIQQQDEQQQREAERRAKFVYEIMIDNAPAAIVGLIGHKEYEQCAKDLYFFLQSAVCMKQLMLALVELLLLAVFPEMDYTIKQLHEEKHKFGEFRSR